MLAAILSPDYPAKPKGSRGNPRSSIRRCLHHGHFARRRNARKRNGFHPARDMLASPSERWQAVWLASKVRLVSYRISNSSLNKDFLKPKECNVISRLQSESFRPLRQVPALL